jgi:hypothetical protein
MTQATMASDAPNLLKSGRLAFARKSAILIASRHAVYG